MSMGKKDPRVDAYIGDAAPFARPILTHLRAVVHAGCPDVIESLKWSRPAFEHHGVLCGMAAFKEYCTFAFWKPSLLGLGDDMSPLAQFGKLTTVKDLPGQAALRTLVARAAKLNQDGVQVARARPAAKPQLEAPPDFLAALRKSKQGAAVFAAFPPSHKREYLEWILEAKTEATRQRRVATAVEWIASGKPRNWKYMPAK